MISTPEVPLLTVHKPKMGNSDHTESPFNCDLTKPYEYYNRLVNTFEAEEKTTNAHDNSWFNIFTSRRSIDK